jgi:hypothetical protein
MTQKVELTKEEIRTIAGLLDAAVRSVGLRALTREAVSVVEKLNEAANRPDDAPEPESKDA